MFPQFCGYIEIGKVPLPDMSMLCLLRESMFTEPWSGISEYPEGHQAALEKELERELSGGHILFGLSSSVIAKREDRDDILIQNELGYFVVHLTWSGKAESDNYPISDLFATLEELRIKLASDSDCF